MTAYGQAAAGWAAGPERVLYGRLAEVLVSACCPDLAGRIVLDLGAGTGAASRAASTAGARVIAADLAPGMLAHDAAGRPPAVAADALALPFADGSVDVVLAAFVLNHLADPAAALSEARRITRPGGSVAASTFHASWDHPVKHAVDEVAARFGYVAPGWYRELKASHAPQAGDPDTLAAATRAAGLAGVHVACRSIDLGATDARVLVGWRLGMAQLSPFLAGLSPADRHRLTEQAVARLGSGAWRLQPEVLLLAATVPATG